MCVIICNINSLTEGSCTSVARCTYIPLGSTNVQSHNYTLAVDTVKVNTRLPMGLITGQFMNFTDIFTSSCIL